jgi:outer membrane protein TolC
LNTPWFYRLRRALASAALAVGAPLWASGWTAEQLVDEALAANPGAEALRQSVEAARWQVEPAGALDDPIFSYALAPASLGADDLDPGHIVGIAQPIPWPGKRATRREAARASVDVADAELTQLQLELAQAARVAHARLRVLESALAINLAQQRVLRDLQETATGVYRTGDGSQHAVLRAASRVAQRKREALDWAAQRVAVRARINALRNRPVTGSVPAPAAWQALPPLPVWSVLQASGREANPELTMLQARSRAARLDRELAELAYRPDLRLTANYLGTLPREENRAQIGIALNLPFGRAKRDAAAAGADAAVARLQSLHADRAAGLAADLLEHRAADQAAQTTQVLHRDELIPLARQTLDAAIADYASGRGDIDAVMDAEEALLSARLGLEQARARQFSQRAQIARITGGSLDKQLFSESTP